MTDQLRRDDDALTRIPQGGFAPIAQFLDCVHCGLCHSACPTYVQLGTEADSPRGRIHVMRALQEGSLALDAEAVEHLDLCLGCRGCETACPSGVQYGALIEAARPWIEAHYRRPLWTRLRRRLTLAILPARDRVRIVLAPLHLLSRLGILAPLRRLLRRVPSPRVRYLVSLVPDPLTARARVPVHTSLGRAEHAHVQLLVGCVMPELFGETVRSTHDVLMRHGCGVTAPPAQRCCGALALHAGDRAGAERLARANVDAFGHDEASAGHPLVVNAAGCGAMMKEYGALLAAYPAYAARAAQLSARVRDATELLAAWPAPAMRRATAAPIRVAYHDPCHLAHAQGVRAAPRRLLARIPGLTLVPMEDEDLCCGSAGHYNVMQPAMARRLVARKVEAIRASGADVVATANSGCALQLEAGLRAAGLSTPVRHVLDLLAEAYGRG